MAQGSVTSAHEASALRLWHHVSEGSTARKPLPLMARRSKERPMLRRAARVHRVRSTSGWVLLVVCAVVSVGFVPSAFAAKTVAKLQLNPAAHGYGTVPLGSSLVFTFTVTNNG